MSVNEILPNVWLGDKTASESGEFYRKMKIGLVVNCTKDLPFHDELLLPTCKKMRLPVDDNLQQDQVDVMKEWSAAVIRVIWKCYARKIPIFVHCYAGVQRSAAIVAMFLIFINGCSVYDAIHRIRQRRPVAFRPSVNFEEAIHHFYSQLYYRLT